MSDTSRDSGTRTLLIVFGLIGGILLVMVVACAGFVYVVYLQMKPLTYAMTQLVQDMQGTQALGNAFLGHIRDGKLKEAYDLTSPKFKQKMTQEAFDAFVKEHASLKQILDMEPDQKDIMPAADKDKGTYQVLLSRKGSTTTLFTLRFLKENGNWMIDGLEVEKEGQVEGAVRSFVEAIKAKRNDSAYQLTTSEFRQRWTRAKLEEFLKEHPVPGEFELGRLIETNGDGSTYRTTLCEPNGRGVFELIIRKDGMVRRVDDLKAP